MKEQPSHLENIQPYMNPEYRNMLPFEQLDRVLLDNRDVYISFADLLCSYYGMKEGEPVKGYKTAYQSLKDAMKKIKKTLDIKGLSLDYKNKRDCKDGFRYPKGIPDPMEGTRSANDKLRLKQLERLIRNSQGLFSDIWLADLVRKTVARQADEEPLIFFDGNPRLKRLELLPALYDAIENRHVVRFWYNPGYRSEKVELTVHPYRLKEYNQRWFLLCESKPVKGRTYGICALDRMAGDIDVLYDEEYKPCQSETFGRHYFKDIIGVTRLKKRKIEHIVIQCHDDKTAGRLITKPLHETQQCEDRNTGTFFSLNVIPNEELYTQLLSFGPSISVIEPVGVREELRKRIRLMLEHYDSVPFST